MKKNRLEAFSDGVFSIVITLLILNVKLPEVSYENLQNGLMELLPTIFVYALSFLLIGMYWVFHHHFLTFIAEVDGVLLWLNILFLLLISFLPFPTMMLGKYPFTTLPVVIYGCNLIIVNLTAFVLLLYLRRNKNLTNELFTSEVYASQLKIYIVINGLYLLNIILSFYIPKFSVYLFALIAVYLIFRSIFLVGVGKCNTPLLLDEE